MHLNQFEIYIVLSALFYAVIIIIIIMGAVRKINSLKKQLRAKFPDESIATISFLLERMKGELCAGDLQLLVKRCNQIPAIIHQGEFSYIAGLEKIIFTKIPLQ